MRQEIIYVEGKENDNGAYKEITIRKKDGTLKVKPLFGELAEKVNSPGWYDVTYTEQENGAYYLTDIRSLENGPKPPPEKPKAEAKPQTYPLPPKAAAGHPRPGNDKDNEIRAAVLLKATAEVMAQAKIPATQAAFKTEAKAVFEAFSSLIDGYCSKAEIEEVPF